MSLLPLTQKANDVLVSARNRALELGQAELLPQHLLEALLAPEAGLRSLLERAGLAPEAMKGLADEARALVERLPRAVGGAEPQAGPAFRQLLERASAAGRELLLHEELFEKLYDKLPKEFQPMRQLLMSALWRRPEGEGLAPEVCC